MSLQEREAEVDKNSVLFGMTLGATAEDEDTQEHGFGTRSVGPGSRVCAIHPCLSFQFLTFTLFLGILHGGRSPFFSHPRP
jgi:hypothetical protein